MTRFGLGTGAGTMGRALAMALVATLAMAAGCADREGPPVRDKDKAKEARALARKRDKLQKVVLPPIASPDCAAPAAAAPAPAPKLTEATGLRTAATEGPAKLTAGPILGAVTDQSVTVWVAADRTVPWRVSVWPAADEKKKAVTVVEGPELSQASDFTAALKLEKLTASTEYAYAVELGAAGAGAIKLPEKKFRTIAAPGTAGKLRVAFGSRLPADDKQPIIRQIGEAKPDLLLLIGDQIYAGELDANAVAYADKYRHNWSVPQLNELMQTVPTFMMWDDQDIKNNYFENSSPTRYAPARLAYELYGQAHNPAPVRERELHYAFDAGDVSFFVLDVRSHRSDPDDDDGDLKSMIGENQKNDLARFLKCSPGKVKVVVTPSPVSNQTRVKEAWPEYEGERQQLIRYLEQEKVDNLIVLSGEASYSALLFHDHKAIQFYELMASPLSKELLKAPGNETKGIVARDDDHHAFGVVDIDTSATPATIAFTLCVEGKPCKPGEERAPSSSLDEGGSKETVPFTVKITANDIGPKAAAPAQPSEPALKK